MEVGLALKPCGLYPSTLGSCLAQACDMFEIMCLKFVGVKVGIPAWLLLNGVPTSTCQIPAHANPSRFLQLLPAASTREILLFFGGLCLIRRKNKLVLPTCLSFFISESKIFTVSLKFRKATWTGLTWTCSSHSCHFKEKQQSGALSSHRFGFDRPNDSNHSERPW